MAEKDTSEAGKLEERIDQIKANGKWEFDNDVAEVFDNMLKRSIPQYQVMRRCVLDLTCKFLKNGETIIDLGSSLGEAIDPLIRKFGAYNHYIGVETAPAMLKLCRNRFQEWIDMGYVEIMDMDLKHNFPNRPAGVITSVFTLQFIPIEYRQRVVSHCHSHLKENGAFIVAEKILGETADLNDVYIEHYLQMKKDNGYSQEEIDRKRTSLEGVLVPVTAAWNEQMLKSAGFRYVDCFWRWMNFAGWVAIK